jgi:hypothetical protein
MITPTKREQASWCRTYLQGSQAFVLDTKFVSVASIEGGASSRVLGVQGEKLFQVGCWRAWEEVPFDEVRDLRIRSNSIVSIQGHW